MARSELGSSSSKSTVDVDDVRADRCEELVDGAVRSVLQGSNDHLGVHSCRDQDVNAAGEASSQQIDGLLVLGVRRIKEGDDGVGVERYSRHSLRSSSR